VPSNIKLREEERRWDVWSDGVWLPKKQLHVMAHIFPGYSYLPVDGK